VVKLTIEDKKKFKVEIKILNPAEVLEVARLINNSPSLSVADKQFCATHIGMRCERFLRNVVKNQSFLD
jgi:hypothetical protein